MKKIIGLLLLLVNVNVVLAEMISSTDFENFKVGTPFVRSLWSSEGFSPADWDQGLADRTMIDDTAAASGLHSMRILYPKNQFGPEFTGCQIPLEFNPRSEAFASYQIRLSENFSWGTTSFGGKLPGLAGGDNCSGGDMCDGTNGFSARLVWRAGGRIVLYLYHMDKPSVYGEDFDLVYPDGSNVFFTPGKWYHVAERVKINTDGSTYDGEVELWIDGRQVLLLTGLRFTSNGDKVDNFYISTFHGGDDETWSSADSCYTWLDDVKIGTEYADVAYQYCRKPEIGADQTLCTGAESVGFSSDIQPKNATYVWLLNGEVFGDEFSISNWTPGQYVLVLDSAGCTRRDTVNLWNDLKPDLGPDVHICNTSFVTLDSRLDSNNLNFEWKKDGKILPEKGSKIQVKDAGLYEITVSSYVCNSVTDSVRVTSGLLPVKDYEGKAGDEVTLSVQEEGKKYAWFESESSDSVLSASYQTHYTDGKSYVYVADPEGFNGTVGEKVLGSAAWTRSNFDTEWMVFTVYRELTIDSFSIYPTGKLDATIRILNDADGSLIFSRTFEGIAPYECRLPIGVTLPAGKYRMDANGTTAALYHSHQAEISFPYKVDGLISLDGCNLAWINAKPWYLFFYNWRITAGNYCARTPILLTGTNEVGLSEATSESWSLYPTVTQNDFYLEGLKDNSIVSVYSELGKLVFYQKTDRTQLKVSLSNLSVGVYTVVVDDENGSRCERVVRR